uniref:Uncharacterized protein n=1 Tax=Arundo donax TaxID=35708 RepID=A0A0A9E8Y6_ARUDO
MSFFICALFWIHIHNTYRFQMARKGYLLATFGVVASAQQFTAKSFMPAILFSTTILFGASIVTEGLQLFVMFSME